MSYYSYNRNHGRGIQWNAANVILAITVVCSLIAFGSESTKSLFQLYLPDLWRGEAWRLFSVGLVHGSLLHLAMNGYALWILGKVYETSFGTKNFIAIYILSLLGGSVAIALFSSSFMPTVGASGAVYGVFGALLGGLYARTGSFRSLIEHPGSRMLLIVLGINIAISFKPGISLSGHMGGLVVGALSGYLLSLQQSRKLAALEQFGALVVLLAVLGGSAYSVRPQHRGAWKFHEAFRLLDIEFELKKNLIRVIPASKPSDYELERASELLSNTWDPFENLESEGIRELRDAQSGLALQYIERLKEVRDQQRGLTE